MTYRVIWEIDIDDAGSPREAAEEAFDAMRRKDTTATVFSVIDEDDNCTRVDLLDEEAR